MTHPGTPHSPEIDQRPPPGDHRAPSGSAVWTALRYRNYRWYFAGQVASVSGTFLQTTALGWVALQTTGSAAMLGLVIAAGSLPTLLIGPWGGVIVDRFDLKRLLIVTQISFGILAGVLWAISAAGPIPVGWLLALQLATGLVSVADVPARQSFVSVLVPRSALTSAISLNGVLMNSGRVVGPAVAGALIATVGATPCFAVNAVSYAAVVIALLAIKPRAGRATNSGGGVWAGVKYARGIAQLRIPLLMMAIVGLLAFNFPVVLPALTQERFGNAGGIYGLLSALLSVGSVVGSLLVGLLPHPRRIWLATAAAGFAVGLGLTAVAPTVFWAGAALTFTGVAAFAFVTLCSTSLQVHVAPQYRGRVMALFGFVYMGTTPIGATLSGWVIGLGGAATALWMGAAACAIAAAGAWLVRTPPTPLPYLHPDTPTEVPPIDGRP
jgi:MFS family permease